MKKLNPERIIVSIMLIIILCSSLYIYGGGATFFPFTNKNAYPMPDLNIDLFGKFKSTSALIAAEEYFQNENFVAAQEEYLSLVFRDSLTHAQKMYSYSMLGMCYYKTQNYEKAANAFLDMLKYDPLNSKALNNAAICYYYLNDIPTAIDCLDKAIDIHPAVEYFYNKARLFEHEKNYTEAIRNLYIVINGQHNLTLVDPISTRTRFVNLLGDKDMKTLLDGSETKITAKLKDTTNTLLIEENIMDILGVDFSLSVDHKKNKKIIGQYNLKENDPYHLIDSISWTVQYKSSTIYTSDQPRFEYLTTNSGTYAVQLLISYKGGKEWSKVKTVEISNDGAPITNPNPSVDIEVEEVIPPGGHPKYYTYAVYEQLFENSFDVTSKGVYDSFSVNWRKTNGIKTQFNKESNLDFGNALAISNTSKSHESIDINLSPLLKDKDLEGKKVNIAIYAKKTSPNESLAMTFRAGVNTITNQSFFLQNQYKQITIPILVPEDCTNLTLTMILSPGDEIIIDGFMLAIMK